MVRLDDGDRVRWTKTIFMRLAGNEVRLVSVGNDGIGSLPDERIRACGSIRDHGKIDRIAEAPPAHPDRVGPEEPVGIRAQAPHTACYRHGRPMLIKVQLIRPDPGMPGKSESVGGCPRTPRRHRRTGRTRLPPVRRSTSISRSPNRCGSRSSMRRVGGSRCSPTAGTLPGSMRWTGTVAATAESACNRGFTSTGSMLGRSEIRRSSCCCRKDGAGGGPTAPASIAVRAPCPFRPPSASVSASRPGCHPARAPGRAPGSRRP